MKKKILPILGMSLLAGIIIWGVVFVFLPQTYWSPSWQYGLREQKKHQITEEFLKFSTNDLIKQIDSNRNWREYKGEQRITKSIHYEASINLLGSKTDDKALAKLKEIILTFPEGQKWAAISTIRKNKNKAMVPALCEALSKHTMNLTDNHIVQALVDLDDPRAFDCLVQEKDKLAYRTSRELAEKAIAKWSRATTKQ
jgi:hypothetical protein